MHPPPLILIITIQFITLFKNSRAQNIDFFNVTDNFYFQYGCLENQNNSEANCRSYKAFNIFNKLKTFQLGPIQFVKTPENAIIGNIRNTEGFTSEEGRSQQSIPALFANSLEYFLQTYAVKIPLPELTKDHPGIVAEKDHLLIEEGRGRKKDSKKFAMIFPILTTFKFLVVKAFLIPILIGVLIIKKMLIIGAMALPALIGLLRVCRGGGFFPPGGGFLTQAGPISAYTAGTDAIVGDFSTYSHSAQTPYHSKTEYGGRSYDFHGPRAR